jgi:hypothetical protein
MQIMNISATIAAALSLSKKVPFVIASFNVWATDLGEGTFFDPIGLKANPNFRGPNVRFVWVGWRLQRVYFLDHLPSNQSMSINASTGAVDFGEKGTL